MNDEMVWLNGQFVAADKVYWPLDDRGLALGDGLFETVRLASGKPRLFGAHWARLQYAAKALAIGGSFAGEQVETNLIELARQNNIKDGSARILLSRGQGPRGLDLPTKADPYLVLRTFAPRPPARTTTKLALSTVRRCASNPLSQYKTISHLDMVMSRQWLMDGAKGNESLLLDTRGYVSCAGVANLFWIKDGVVFTPSLSCASLPGTTRARVLRACQMLDIPVRSGAFYPKIMLRADCIFITNALIGLQAVRAVDLGYGNRSKFVGKHPILQQLQNHERAMG
ncbi:hypothetical protein MNBD_ALPHA06-1564 [hydrothermal vent metagenome]|uniref:Aminodeoxychorismate lyase n=1 Tax=hydrothermal vent metagenome TaxID=652676 RepID=A0A3B0R9K3_9ZZZZ